MDTLSVNGSVPEMSGWRWIHSKGHTPGHISLYEDRSRALIAGDAFVTVGLGLNDRLIL
ncbi:MBL fold metallo-hydrolase [Cohnella mopanensis]|uniref:MBL fold metallo-hydrolase n=1 Tax=Cohnella mopanensis TaxID=2911966 RepID=UPI003F7119FC